MKKLAQMTEQKNELSELLEYLTYKQFKELLLFMQVGSRATNGMMSNETRDALWDFFTPRMPMELACLPPDKIEHKVFWLYERLQMLFRIGPFRRKCE